MTFETRRELSMVEVLLTTFVVLFTLFTLVDVEVEVRFPIPVTFVVVEVEG